MPTCQNGHRRDQQSSEKPSNSQKQIVAKQRPAQKAIPLVEVKAEIHIILRRILEARAQAAQALLVVTCVLLA